MAKQSRKALKASLINEVASQFKKQWQGTVETLRQNYLRLSHKYDTLEQSKLALERDFIALKKENESLRKQLQELQKLLQMTPEQRDEYLKHLKSEFQFTKSLQELFPYYDLITAFR